MSGFTYLNSLNEQVHVLRGDCGDQLWTLGYKRGSSITCAVTGKEICSGDKCYRPLTNAYNRWERISVAGMEQLIVASGGTS